MRLIEQIEDFGDRPIEERVVITLAALFLLTLIFAIVIAILESFWLKPPVSNKPARPGPLAEKAMKAPNIPPLIVLPTQVMGVETKIRHTVPGKSYAAEAIYRTEDEYELIRNPFTVYAIVTYFSSEQEAMASVLQRLQENGSKRERAKIGGHSAFANLNSTGDTYFIGWTEGMYSIEIDSTFAQRVPGEAGPMIEFTQNVAKEIDKSAAAIRQANGGQ
jgi:hypothetical protein